MFSLKDKAVNAQEFIENYLYIVDKFRKQVPFKFKNIQQRLFDKLGKKTLVLKSRKPGVSSAILALWTSACIWDDNTRAVVISHEGEATKRMLDRVYYYIDTMAVKPETDRKSRQEIRFTETNSSFYIGTAGSKAFGRGDDITHLHVSEFDWWEHPEMLDGLIEACVPDAYIVIETTANGFGGKFWKLWHDAKVGNNSWTPLFFGWHEDEDNNEEVPSILKRTTEEKKLLDIYDLEDSQIQWRRNKIASMLKPSLFPQEYPINDIEAFLFSGRNYFDVERLKKYYLFCKEPATRGYLKRKGNIISFDQDAEGWLKVWHKPVENERYIISVDTAEGLGQDFSVATVGTTDKRIVATLKCDIDPAQFAVEIEILGYYYNNAHIAVERNNHGLTVITLLDKQMKYKNLYKYEWIDKSNGSKQILLGFKTTEDSRKLILDKLDEDTRHGSIEIPSKDIINEMMAFIINKTGKAEAQPGSNDDFVLATAIYDYICINYSKRINDDNPQFQFKSRRSGY